MKKTVFSSQLENTVAYAGPDLNLVFAKPAQIAHPFFLNRRDVNKAELSRSKLICKLQGIALVGFDPFARSLEGQRRGDHLAVNSMPD